MKRKKNKGDIRELNHDVYANGKYYLCFSILFMLSLNKSHKNRKCLLLFTANTEYFDSNVQRAEDRRQKFIFAVYRKRQA